MINIFIKTTIKIRIIAISNKTFGNNSTSRFPYLFLYFDFTISCITH